MSKGALRRRAFRPGWAAARPGLAGRAALCLAALLLAFSQCASDVTDRRWAQTNAAGQLIAVAGWKPAGPPDTFTGDELFIYINGGAELYREYGFEGVRVQDFDGPGGGRIALELFEMDNPAAAFGIYSFKRGDEGVAVSVGTGGFLEGYYLNFWQGNTQVTLTGQNDSAQTVRGLKIIAAAAAAGIDGNGAPPSIVATLATAGLIETSIVYIAGPLALYNAYPFFTDDAFAFREAVKADYERGYSIFLFGYGDARECGRKFSSIRARFGTSPRYSALSVEGNALTARDRRGTLIHAEPCGAYIVAVVGAPDRLAAEAAVRAQRAIIELLPAPFLSRLLP